jgi:hypothetical protein
VGAVDVALIGLLGVLVGGLVSGGATFLLTRRAERRRAMASIRLLEEELKLVGRQTEALSQERSFLAGDVSSQFLGNLFEAADGWTTAIWPEHRPVFAENASSEDWYRVSEAFLWVAEAKGLSASRRESKALPFIPKHAWFEEGFRHVSEGAGVLTRLSRGQR